MRRTSGLQQSADQQTTLFDEALAGSQRKIMALEAALLGASKSNSISTTEFEKRSKALNKLRRRSETVQIMRQLEVKELDRGVIFSDLPLSNVDPTKLHSYLAVRIKLLKRTTKDIQKVWKRVDRLLRGEYWPRFLPTLWMSSLKTKTHQYEIEMRRLDYEQEQLQTILQRVSLKHGESLRKKSLDDHFQSLKRIFSKMGDRAGRITRLEAAVKSESIQLESMRHWLDLQEAEGHSSLVPSPPTMFSLQHLEHDLLGWIDHAAKNGLAGSSQVQSSGHTNRDFKHAFK